MLTIFNKEVAGFFSSLTGYIAMVVFLLVVGLFVWVFPDTNALDFGFANLDTLFFYAPWVFMFLIPAVTMRSFSEELRSGTIELLLTRPLGELQIVLGKYFAALFLVVFTLVPTALYYYTVYKLGSPAGNIDSGATIGSYIGLVLLAASFTSIGIFASSLSRNPAVAFVVAVFLCFITYSGFDMVSRLPFIEGRFDTLVQNIGINEHYQSISRGVVDTRDVIYFVSFAAIFLLATRLVIESRK
ncbi:MAG TPA: gliding motility-associated ABC transporter permease subunit GldF, partial [Chitinophagales bacterium]|nr:gliding motility-associated ABC transporter permease subunit GldF [Chitinophagales bacterium]